VGLALRDSGVHTRGSLLDFGADQLCALPDDHLEVWNNPWTKLRAFDQLVPSSPYPTHGTYQIALSASIALSLYDLLWMRGSRLGINSAKAFSSPGVIVRAKESRALRPDDCMFSSFPVRNDSTISRIFKMDEDDEVRISSESLSTRTASKSSVPDLS